MERNEMIEANLPLAKNLARDASVRFVGLHLDLGDFLAWGVIGLMHAVDHYNPKKHFAFSTYAHRCIECQILTGIEQFRGVKSGNNSVRSRSMEFVKKFRQFKDSQTPRFRDGGQQKVDDSDELAHALSVLNDRDKLCLRMLYVEGKSYVDVASSLGVSRQRVFQLRNNALRRVRAALKQTSGEVFPSSCRP